MKEKLPPPSEKFLEELVERGRQYGWTADYVEIAWFIEELYRQAGISFTMPEPYSHDDEE